MNGDAPADSLVQRVHVINNDVRGAAGLAVARVLGEEQRAAVECESSKHGEPGFKLVLPLETEAKTVYVEGLGSRPVRTAKLWSDELCHRR